MEKIQDPTVPQLIVEDLQAITDAVIEAVPDPLDDRDRIELAVLKTLQVVERYTQLSYTEVEAVLIPEHEGPDLQYHNVPCTQSLENITDLYWKAVNS